MRPIPLQPSKVVTACGLGPRGNEGDDQSPPVADGSIKARGTTCVEGTERGFHRAEYLQQIPQASLTHNSSTPTAPTPSPCTSQFDLSLWNRRMIAYGVERQKIFVLGFALSQNATSHRIHLEARSNAQQALLAS